MATKNKKNYKGVHRITMRRVYQYILIFINIPRSIPIFMVYFLMKDKTNLNADIKRDTTLERAIKLYPKLLKTQYMKLHYLLIYNCVFRNILYFRIREYSVVLAKISKIFYPIKIDCGLDSKIGPGLVVYHGNSSVIFAEQIGKNFTVYQQVTIGRGKNINGRNTVVIGDNVVVYAGAKIVGGINIGDNCIIGAGAVVTKDIPNNCTVVGNPAKIIKKDGKRI